MSCKTLAHVDARVYNVVSNCLGFLAGQRNYGPVSRRRFVYKVGLPRVAARARVVDVTRRDTPEQWLPLLERQRIHSARQLAEQLGISPQTATRLLHGEQTSEETITAAADLLRVAPAEIRRLRGEVVLPPFRLPADADKLTPAQRAAVRAVVRAMLQPTGEADPDATELQARGEQHLDELNRKRIRKT